MCESAMKRGKMKDQYRFGSVDVFVKDPVPDSVDLPEFLFSYISARVPFYLTRILM